MKRIKIIADPLSKLVDSFDQLVTSINLRTIANEMDKDHIDAVHLILKSNDTICYRNETDQEEETRSATKRIHELLLH